jgi:acyl-coenzyme A synthetase/AMP-(fatty) acid ligase
MRQPGYADFAACDTASDDVCLIAFTSGTTGEPKGTMHFHRDMLVVGDTYGRYVLRAAGDDRFISTAPLAFTFGLGGIALFPLRIGASSILIEKTTPHDLIAAIAAYRATVCFTAPTAYRAMLPLLAAHDVSSLRKCVSAGETLPKATYEAWRDATGIRIMDGIGARCCTFSSARPRIPLARARPAGRSRATRPVSSTRTAGRSRPGRSAGSRCADRPAAATWPMRGKRHMCSTDGT